MRLWSLHPKYLDIKGLTGLWREALLAKRVFEGKTTAYMNHPQLNRFKISPDPLNSINFYLAGIFEESLQRNYHFTKEFIDWDFKPLKLPLNKKQLEYEAKHLLLKLKVRDKIRYKEFRKIKIFEPHPIFKLVNGDIENWEKIK